MVTPSSATAGLAPRRLGGEERQRREWRQRQPHAAATEEVVVEAARQSKRSKPECRQQVLSRQHLWRAQGAARATKCPSGDRSKNYNNRRKSSGSDAAVAALRERVHRGRGPRAELAQRAEKHHRRCSDVAELRWSPLVPPRFVTSPRHAHSCVRARDKGCTSTSFV